MNKKDSQNNDFSNVEKCMDTNCGEKMISLRRCEEKVRDYLRTKRRFKMYKCKILDLRDEHYWMIPNDIIKKVVELKKYVANDLDTEECDAGEYYLEELEKITHDIKEMYEDEIIPQLLEDPAPVQCDYLNLQDKPEWQFEDINPDDWKYNDTYEGKFDVVCVNEEGQMMSKHISSIYFPEDVYVELLSHLMSDSYNCSDFYTFNDLVIDKPELARGITATLKTILERDGDFYSFVAILKYIKEEAQQLVNELEIKIS